MDYIKKYENFEEPMDVRKIIIDNIKKRIDVMANCCNVIRTLNGCIAARGETLVIVLNDLRASWDSDRRPELSNGKVINYIDFKLYIVIDSGNNSFSLEELNNEDLKAINSYMEMMIPKASSESMIGYYKSL